MLFQNHGQHHRLQKTWPVLHQGKECRKANEGTSRQQHAVEMSDSPRMRPITAGFTAGTTGTFNDVQLHHDDQQKPKLPQAKNVDNDFKGFSQRRRRLGIKRCVHMSELEISTKCHQGRKVLEVNAWICRFSFINLHKSPVIRSRDMWGRVRKYPMPKINIDEIATHPYSNWRLIENDKFSLAKVLQWSLKFTLKRIHRVRISGILD